MVVVYMVLGSRKSGPAFALSLGLHAGLALLLWQLAPPPPPGLSRPIRAGTLIELLPRPNKPALTVEPSAPPPPDERPMPPRPLSPAPSRVTGSASQPSSHAPATEALLPRRAPAPPTTPPVVLEKPTGRIDLFPQAVLCKTIGCSQGLPPAAGQGLASHLAEEQAQREGLAAVREGRVAPGWREVEHDLEKLFTPKLDSVSRASRGELALRQLVRPVQPAPEQSQTGWLVRRDDMNRLQAEIRAAQDAYDEAAVGREAEVEVELDRLGAVVAVRLILPSGSREFDREALRAVQQAVRVRPLHDQQGPVIARYGLRGEVAINLPRIGSAVEPNGGQVHSQLLSLGGTFDEVTGKADVRIPGTKRLKTRIRLISVRRKLTGTTP